MNQDRKTRVYLGGPLFTNSQKIILFKIYDFLNDSDKFEVFSPYHSSKKIWAGRAPKDCTEADREQVFEDNYTHLEWADVLIAWLGGMDEITNNAGNNLVFRIKNDSLSGTVYHGEIDDYLDLYLKEYKPAPSDIGVTWEMGYIFGYNQALKEYGDDYNNYRRLCTQILAYIDDSDERQSINLMLERAVDGVARGFDQLREALILYHENGRFAGTVNLSAESEPVH